MTTEPDLLDLRCLWALYVSGDWITVALLCRDWNAALWDLDGVTCDCTLTRRST